MSDTGSVGDEPPAKRLKTDNDGTAPPSLASIPVPVTGLNLGPQFSVETDSTGAQVKVQSHQKPVAVVTSGNIRPTLLIPNSQSDTTKHLSSVWTTTDGKAVTLQFASPTLIPSKSPCGQSPASSPRFPVPQVITLPAKTSPAPTTAKPVSLVNPSAGQKPFSIVTSVGEPIKGVPVTTQISFTMPAWNTPGKSLLDTSKVSLVNVNISLPETTTRSLLNSTSNINDNGGAAQLSSTSKIVPSVGNESAVKVSNTHKASLPVTSTIPPKVIFTTMGSNVASVQKTIYSGPSTVTSKTYITGNKMFGNLAGGQVITTPTGVVVTRPAAKINKGNVLISNKQFTIVPGVPGSNPVMTQLVKTDTKINKGQVTMAEAQIMLPSGPAKISWPVPSQMNTTQASSDTKQILIKTHAQPLLKGKTLITTTRPNSSVQSVTIAATSGSPAATAKLIGVSPSKGNGKTSVLPAQKSWELVKQSPQLNPNFKNTPVANPKDSKNSNGKTAEKVAAESKNESAEIKAKSLNGKTPQKNNGNSQSSDASSNGKQAPQPVQKANVTEKEKNDGTEKVNEVDDIDGGHDNINANTRLEAASNKTDAENEHSNDSITDKDDGKNHQQEETDADPENCFVNVEVHDEVTDSLECDETLDTSEEQESMETSNMEISRTETKEEHIVPKGKHTAGSTPVKSEVSNKDEIVQCENCGDYGFITDFVKGGKFCNQTCLDAFDGRHMRDVKKPGNMSKVILGIKKGRKKHLIMKEDKEKEEKKENDQQDKQQDHNSYGKKSKSFVWTRYLLQEKAVEAPARLFKNPFPSAKNLFRVGLKLEGVDPNHQSKFCVLSVAEVCGYRVRLHFDGYSECYDFWTDIDSPYIFPIGFSEKNGKVLQPPKGISMEQFSWVPYLKMTKSQPAPKSLFSNQPVTAVTPNIFRVGSKLEAVDKKNSSLICVASVADIMGDKVLIHFDSWADNYDYWCDMSSPMIHPIGYCEENGLVLSPPQDWTDVSGWTWEQYLTKTKSQAVPPRAFKPRQPVAFEAGMKVEVVDKRNPLLVRVATVTETDEFQVKIHFDGWADQYDYWLEDDSPDIHPPGWCAKTGHPLVPPITPSDLVVNSGPGICPTSGCKGIGHIKGPKYSGHHSTFGCPYSELNMHKEVSVSDRLGTPGKEDMTSISRPHDLTGSPETGGYKVTVKSPHMKTEKRGRKPKSYYQALEDQKQASERQQMECENNLRQGIHNSVFSSSMISAPKPDVPLCWEQHCKLLPGVTNISGNDVNKWTIEQVAAFINTLPGCEEQAKLFKEEQIDGEAFLLLTQTDIVKIMNIKLGPALKIFNSIIMFKNSIQV
ncbi:uncharacterized protein LOC127844401 [Dreissena polymorpha]|uniref:SAM domain-containing protein n=1 Tax=Dreissena polymorpha TaxID=45954 RepID=A0A9D4EAA8_DREPO|nr:uncharacterized protein LOC127844401 [Dreissena polymorpha]XP_052230507.1 uncharacterized protein LOC127844401 [Dreissena polymorpha]XP_052230508.1 uncharacterized protein LOC127844401 [Dreissena polymorpha]KAH3775648.1 hypothetical protein DPMN_177054 [Dreissena polymorpha]